MNLSPVWNTPSFLKVAWSWGDWDSSTKQTKVLKTVLPLAFFTCKRNTRVVSYLSALYPFLTSLPLPGELACLNAASLNISGWALLPHMSVTFQAGYHMFRLWPPSPLTVERSVVSRARWGHPAPTSALSSVDRTSQKQLHLKKN